MYRLATGSTTRGSKACKTRDFLFSPKYPEQLWGPPTLLFSGYLGIKRTGREVHHSPPSNAEIKNKWGYITAPSMRLHTEGRKNFAFY